MKKIALTFFAVFIVLLVFKAYAADIMVTGNWMQTLNSSNLISGAGSDLTNSYESVNNATLISVTNTTGNWKVTVKKMDNNWDKNLHIYVRRSSGMPDLQEGVSYIEVRELFETFFTGTVDNLNIPIQYLLTGVSLGVSPMNYSTTIYYYVQSN